MFLVPPSGVVAVTVSVYVPAGVPVVTGGGGGVVPEPPPPPQPFNATIPRTRTIISDLRRLALVKSTQPIETSAKVKLSKNGQSNDPDVRGMVPTVIVTFAFPLPATIVCGVTVQVAFSGAPEHDKVR